MSALQHPQGLTPSDVQIWNNAAFDHGGSEELGRSWSPKKPLLVKKIAESFGSVSTKEKENRSPLFENSVCPKSPRRAVKPLHPNGALENSKFVSGAGNFKSGSVDNKEVGIRDEKVIDKEIAEVEKEISLLSSRLQALRMEKAERSVKNVERRGRVVTAKFLEPKQIFKNAEERKKMEEKSKIQRRGLSLGPCEILSAVKSPLGKQGMITPIQPIQSRRKSCFWKLQETDEENQRNTVGKPLPSRQAVTTLPSKKTAKKDEVFLQSVQPKNLFEKSAPAANKKCQRAGRIVPSRYNLSASTQRKRSFPPESDKEESKRRDKKRSVSLGKALLEMVKNPGTEIRTKKRWEIPEEIVLHEGPEESERSAEKKTCVAMPDKTLLLPRINTIRCVRESPRDSGPAKRVAELAGRKSFFASNDNEEDDDLEEEERVICQALQFADDD